MNKHRSTLFADSAHATRPMQPNNRHTRAIIFGTFVSGISLMSFVCATCAPSSQTLSEHDTRTFAGGTWKRPTHCTALEFSHYTNFAWLQPNRPPSLAFLAPMSYAAIRGDMRGTVGPM